MESEDDQPKQREPRPYDGAFEAADPLTQGEVLRMIRARKNWVDTPRLRDYLTKLWLARGG